MTGYRYVSAAEVSVIRVKRPWRVPNVDLAGRKKLIYFTWDSYASKATAELALQIGRLNPWGATAAPSDRLDLDLTGVSYTDHGIVHGGTGTEVSTPDSPLVTVITLLSP